jgi:CNT family concentrative nucleoside transporter
MLNGTSVPPAPEIAHTPLRWRLVIAAGILALGGVSYALSRAGWLAPRGQSAIGLICFISLVAMFSANLRAVNWRTIGFGFGLQLLLALFVTSGPGHMIFEVIGNVIKQLLLFSDEGAKFVFGKLAEREKMEEVFGKGGGFVFAFRTLPTIIFISSFFTVLYYLRVLPLAVRGMAWLMMYLLKTSGAETLAAAASVFMGQTEAPLIVKPYVARMTQSELFTMMVGGMAHISGGLLAVYIGMNADPVAILATCVMASPGGLYLSKLLMPETEIPETRAGAPATLPSTHRNVIDAASGGAADGLGLALNVAAMLIAFLAFIALFNALLGLISPQLSLQSIFSYAFAPLAFLMGIEPNEVPRMAELLGTKLVANEFLAYTDFSRIPMEGAGAVSPRFRVLATYALTGFANFASIGIQIGGIGAIAPDRRKDLARLGLRALFVGFLASLVNASIAGMLLSN